MNKKKRIENKEIYKITKTLIKKDKKMKSLIIKNKSFLLFMGILICIQLLLTEYSYAGTEDATMTPILTKLTDWLKGTMGKIIAVTALIFAVIGGAIKFNPGLIAGALGVALIAGLGPAVIEGLFSATI